MQPGCRKLPCDLEGVGRGPVRGIHPSTPLSAPADIANRSQHPRLLGFDSSEVGLPCPLLARVRGGLRKGVLQRQTGRSLQRRGVGRETPGREELPLLQPPALPERLRRVTGTHSVLPNKSGTVSSVTSKDVALPWGGTAPASAVRPRFPPTPGEIWNKTPPPLSLSPLTVLHVSFFKIGGHKRVSQKPSFYLAPSFLRRLEPHPEHRAAFLYRLVTVSSGPFPPKHAGVRVWRAGVQAKRGGWGPPAFGE